MTRTAEVIVASTRAAAGMRNDISGRILADWLVQEGFDVGDPVIIADKEIPDFIQSYVSGNLPRVVLFTGGTGLSPDDLTVDSLAPKLQRQLPGVIQQFYTIGNKNTPLAVCSRAIAGTINQTFIMALPGSPAACRDGITTLTPIIHPICDMLEGIHAH